tara:strand:+ start:4370 stop:4693 length:324 start_codon:yes stop_codon:yes gene_type:complete
MALITPILFGAAILISVLLVTRLHQPKKTKKRKSNIDHFALLTILFVLGFLALQGAEYTGLATREVVTGLTPTSEMPEDFSLTLSGLIIALLGVVLFFIAKRRANWQ